MLTKQINDASMMETEKMAYIPHRVRLAIGETNDKVEVLINRPIVIGRSDEEQTVDIDLTHKGGYRLGISRQHLSLAAAGTHVIATDLNSRNGTKLNGEEMTPMQNYTVKSGDNLQLSGLTVHISAIN